MFAPQIKNLISFGRQNGGKSALDTPGRRKLDKLFVTLGRFEVLGDDNLHVLWLRAERSTIGAFGDAAEWMEEREVSSHTEFKSWWPEVFPAKNLTAPPSSPTSSGFP